MVILFTGGGTGGHIFPCLAVKKELEKIVESSLKKELYFYFLFAGKIPEEEIKRTQIRWIKIFEVKWRRYFSFKNFLDILKFPILCLQVAFYLWLLMPDLIFSKGGTSSWVVTIFGWLFGIPVVIHESDFLPGISNKISSPFSKKILVSFKETKKLFPLKKVEFIGHPLREGIINPPENPKKIIGIQGDRKVILFIGGSQGSKEINDLLIEALNKYLKYFEIIHICGKAHFKELQLFTKGFLKENQKKYYHLFSYLGEEKLSAAILSADLIVTRAGAGILFEISFLGKPSLIIPLSSSSKDHQIKNAYFFKKKKAAIVIEGENLKPNFLFEKIREILENEKFLKEISENAKKLAPKDGTQKIAKILLEIL